MSKERFYLGKNGEALAEEFLKNTGYSILARNYRTKLGEIDIIAREEETICFIEVKTRTGERFGLPEEALTHHKQQRISRASLVFLNENKLFDQKARFDVVSIMQSGDTAKINLIRNAFELDERFTC
jgi:putative endonuclease